METKPKLAKGVSISCITVSDLKKAKEFFVETLGMEIKDFQEKYNWMEVGTEEGSLIGIGQSCEEGEKMGFTPGSNAIISIDVENIEAAVEHLKSKNVKFLGEIMEIPGEVKMILFQDFDGNRFYLCESLKKKG